MRIKELIFEVGGADAPTYEIIPVSEPSKWLGGRRYEYKFYDDEGREYYALGDLYRHRLYFEFSVKVNEPKPDYKVEPLGYQKHPIPVLNTVKAILTKIIAKSNPLEVDFQTVHPKLIRLYDRVASNFTRWFPNFALKSRKQDEELVSYKFERIADPRKKKELSENFADGKGPGRPGDSQRHGIPKKASMAQLKKAANADLDEVRITDKPTVPYDYDAENPDWWVGKDVAAGITGYNSNVDYMGLRVAMQPSKYLELAARLEDDSTSNVEKHLSLGGSIGAPHLYIEIPNEWIENGNFTKPASITGHEGRHRMRWILRNESDDPVEVHLFFRNGLRRRDITPKIIAQLKKELMSEETPYDRPKLVTNTFVRVIK